MKIAVYCSAKDAISEEYLRLGDELGSWIGEAGHTLVYGGATGGLMSRVSAAAKSSGAYVIGVIPTKIIKMGRQADRCDELVRVADMAERKRVIREMADCCVCLPGGYGTLDEMFDVIGSGTVGEHNKPLFIVNYGGIYDGIKAVADRMQQLGFIPTPENYSPIFVSDIAELTDKIIKIQTKR